MMVKPLLPPLKPPIEPIAAEAAALDLVIRIGTCAAMLAAFLLALWIVLHGQKKELKIKMPIALLCGAGIGLIILVLFGCSITALKGLLLTLILFYASLSDLGRREVPDFVSAMIFILSFVGFAPEKLVSMLIGALVVFVPQVAISIVRPKKAIGGADIKISTALAFMLGAEKGIFALLIGLIAGIITMLILRKAKKVEKGEAFPLVPFLSFGALLAFCI